MDIFTLALIMSQHNVQIKKTDNGDMDKKAKRI